MKKVKASMMNAIHDLPLLVARDEGYFRDEGLDVEISAIPITRRCAPTSSSAPWKRSTTRAPATSSACASGA